MTSQPMQRNRWSEPLQNQGSSYDYSAILSTRRPLNTAELDILITQATLWRVWNRVKCCCMPRLLLGMMRRDRRGYNPV